MTRFQDGPAQGIRPLRLRRTPVYLRVVVKDGKWDALDQPTDRPEPEEQVYAYELAEKPQVCFVRASGGMGGRWDSAVYRLVPEQPDDGTMRVNDRWRKWADGYAATHPREDLR